MTEQERELLNTLLANLVRTPAGQKDPEAEDLVHRALARQPDAAYLLVQRTLLQDIALRNAQFRINQLEQQLQGSGSGSFLGGGRQAPPPSPGGWRQPPPRSGGWNQSPPPQDFNMQPAPPNPPQPGAFSGFLRSAATTAAGVAGGALLFEGLEGIFGHHGGMGQPPEIVENIIEEPPANSYEDRGFPQNDFLPNNSFQQDDWGNNPGFDDSNNFL